MPKNYAIMRCQKIKTLTDLKLAIDHNRRNRVPQNACPDMPLKDRLFEFYDKGVGDFKVYEEKSRKNAVKAVEWLFTASDILGAAQKTNDQHFMRKWCQDNIDFVAKKMGGHENILSAVVHWDETSPHMHIIAVPEYNHKLNCRYYLGGNKWVMRDLQNEYFDKMKVYGLDRGEPKQRKYNDHIKSDIKALENRLVELQEEVKKNELEIKNLDLKYNEYQNSLSIKVETKKENEKEKILSAEDIKNKYKNISDKDDELIDRMIEKYKSIYKEPEEWKNKVLKMKNEKGKNETIKYLQKVASYEFEKPENIVNTKKIFDRSR